jgi:hypothetical protein
MHAAKANYDFPVALQPVFTAEGHKAPRVQAVVRLDTQEPIATVGSRYGLVTHSRVMEAVQPYISQFGEPNPKHTAVSLSANGARLVAQYTYTDRTLAVNKGDLVGFRLLVENSYNSSSCIKIMIGGMVLKCTNGMMMPKDVFSLQMRHMRGVEDMPFNFPSAEEVLGRFMDSRRLLSAYDEVELNRDTFTTLVQGAHENGIVGRLAVEKIEDSDRTLWDLYNVLTYNVTHDSKAQPIGKLGKLNRIAEYVQETYHTLTASPVATQN